MGAMGKDRRSSPRQEVKTPNGFRLWAPESGGKPRPVTVKLVDVSETGVGIESFVPLHPGAVVQIEGRLRSGGLKLRINGSALIVYAEERARGVYRAGLEFVDVAYARTA
jgi:hypothetical protein